MELSKNLVMEHRPDNDFPTKKGKEIQQEASSKRAKKFKALYRNKEITFFWLLKNCLSEKLSFIKVTSNNDKVNVNSY